MRAVLALLMPMFLAACTQGVYSQSPLFTAGAASPADGLWALLREGCAPPDTIAIPRWPDCAIPVWLEEGQATAFFGPTPSHLNFVLGEGDPPIMQFEGIRKLEPGEAGAAGMPGTGRDNFEHGFVYWAFMPGGPAPFRKGKAWMVPCTDQEIAGLAHNEDGCVAATAQAVTAASRIAPKAEDLYSAVWIGPAE